MHPPKWSHALLKFFVKKRFWEEIEGDMEEVFQDNLENHSVKRANRMYFLEVLKLLRPIIIRKIEGTQKLNNYGMLKNNIKIAIRSLIKQKGYTAINILGLSTSMAISMLIIIFIIDQGRMDEHNPAADRIYRVITEFDDAARDRVTPFGTSPYEFNQTVQFNLDVVEDAAQIISGAGVVTYDNKSFGYSGLHVSSNFIDFFAFDLIKGDKKIALKDINAVVLSSELALKLFADQDALGQLIEINDLGTFKVTGIIDNKNLNSHMSFDLLLPRQVFTQQETNKVLLSDWEGGSKRFYNYFRLDNSTSAGLLLTYLNDLNSTFPVEKQALYAFNIQRLDNINLGRLIKNEIGITTPNIISYFFIVLALVLILSASFNYMNLSIARGLTRAKEVGIRKMIGAEKRQIIVQFLVEAQLVTFCSLVLAFISLQLLVPVFNNLSLLDDINGAITMNFNSSMSVYAAFLAFTVFVGLVSGAYPAYYLSSFNSLNVIKGLSNSGKSPRFLFRKFLVFCQYSFSIIFIITTIILYQQAKLFANADYGFNYENVVNVPMPNIPYKSFRAELLQRSEIKGVSAVSELPVLSNFKEVFLINRNAGENESKSSMFSIDPYALENLGLSTIAGRNFKANLQDDEVNAILINEKALDVMGFENAEEALNQTIEIKTKTEFGGSSTKNRIIGIVQHFDYQFSFRESGPLVMNYDPSKLNMINIKIEGAAKLQAFEAIENVWETFDTDTPLEFELYQSNIYAIDKEFEELVGIVGIVAFIAILISCLGQVSMIIHHIQLKVKEIGIRKVLGANLWQLMFKLSRGFLVIILIAIMLATPLAWKINMFWTSKVYTAPDVSIGNLSVGIGLILIMAFMTMFVIIRKAVRQNPVESLKYE